MDYQHLENTLLVTTLWASGISSLMYILALSLQKEHLKKLGFMGMLASFFAITGALIARLLLSGHPPISNFYESLIYVIWAMLGMYLIVSQRYNSLLFSVGTAPTVFLLMGVSSILPATWRQSGPLVPALQSYWINIHVTLMLISYAAFALSAVTSVLYLIFSWRTEPALAVAGRVHHHEEVTLEQVMTHSSLEEGHDKNKHLVLFDEMTHRLIMFGFPILGIGIIMGALWANHAWGTYWSWDPKETAALMTWLFYAGYIHFRYAGNWKGRKAAVLSLVGFIAVIFTYYGVNYLPGLHSYGF